MGEGSKWLIVWLVRIRHFDSWLLNLVGCLCFGSFRGNSLALLFRCDPLCDCFRIKLETCLWRRNQSDCRKQWVEILKYSISKLISVLTKQHVGLHNAEKYHTCYRSWIMFLTSFKFQHFQTFLPKWTPALGAVINAVKSVM